MWRLLHQLNTDMRCYQSNYSHNRYDYTNLRIWFSFNLSFILDIPAPLFCFRAFFVSKVVRKRTLISIGGLSTIFPFSIKVMLSLNTTSYNWWDTFLVKNTLKNKADKQIQFPCVMKQWCGNVGGMDKYPGASLCVFSQSGLPFKLKIYKCYVTSTFFERNFSLRVIKDTTCVFALNIEENFS